MIFFGYNAASNVSLLFNPEEFEARITDVSSSNTHRSFVDTYRIRLEYEEDGEIKKNSAGFYFPKRKRPVNSLYIMANDYKIRKVKNAESASFYINQLKKHEIICFGITDRDGFAEYSYEQNEFIERTASKGNETEETIDEFSIESVVREKMKVRDKAGK